MEGVNSRCRLVLCWFYKQYLVLVLVLVSGDRGNSDDDISQLGRGGTAMKIQQ
jgi:hypothetical protein